MRKLPQPQLQSGHLNPWASWLSGEYGNDTLDGGQGNDVLLGGKGYDRYEFSTADWVAKM